MQENKITKRSYNIKNLFLDPNNYRFADNKEYKFVLDDKLLDFNIQKRTRNFIEGNKRENIKDLISSFKANGFLDVDAIQAKEAVNEFVQNNYHNNMISAYLLENIDLDIRDEKWKL